MVLNSVISFGLQWLASVAACFLFLALGSVVMALAGKESGLEVAPGGKGGHSAFYPLFHGVNFGVSLYAVVRTHFVTIYSLVIGAYAIWLIGGWRRRRRAAFGRNFSEWKWIAAGCLFFTTALHFLPAGQFKQYDTFFYTKIAESLNATGQENLHGYNNLFAAVFHGTEPYHYVEIWMDSLLMRFTSSFLPDIEVFRFVGYTVLCVSVLLGLWEFYTVFAGRRAGRGAKLFCLAFFFFFPDILVHAPSLQHYLVYGFENNPLERPNFLPVYLYLLPFLLNKDRIDAEGGVYFVSLAMVSYLIFPVVIAVGVVFGLIGLAWPGKRQAMFRKIGLSVAVGSLFFLFYYFFGNRALAGAYRNSPAEVLGYLKRSPFFVGSTILTTLGYMGLVLLVYCSYFLLRKRVELFRCITDHGWLFAEAGGMVIGSVVIARVLSYQDNTYQVAFLGYMLCGLFVFAIWASFSAVVRSRGYLLIGVVVLTAGYILFKIREGREAGIDVFRQNGTALYGGKPYSGVYLARVAAYAAGRRRMIGGYLADGVYYRDLFYSSRNPNVYSLPLTYVIAGEAGANYDFCLSDSAVLFAGLEKEGPYQQRYLEAAVRRSGFYQYQHGNGLTRHEALFRFIRERQLEYLILSGEACEGELAGLPVRERFEDQSTGEVFLVIGK